MTDTERRLGRSGAAAPGARPERPQSQVALIQTGPSSKTGPSAGGSS
jgi:hypothetical protein